MCKWILKDPILLYLLATMQYHFVHGRVLVKSDEQRLMEQLLTGYDKKVRPVKNSSIPVEVQLGITLTMIMDVDERNQVLTTNIWLDQQWTDFRLKWNASDFGGLETIRVPCDCLWLPDIVLYNSVDDHSRGYHQALAMVYPNGRVFWPPIVRSRSSCKLDITYFPFDDQICHMKFGSWAYDGNQLDVQKLKEVVDTRNLVQNGEWNLLGSLVQRNVKRYPCCPEPYPDITFYVLMQRRNLYYVFNVIIPCLVLSLLTLGGFFLPPNSGEKVTLGLTVLLAYSVFMLLIAENMPPTSEFAPLIGVYLTVVMALTSLSVIFAVAVLNLHYRGNAGTTPPRLIMRFCRHYLRRIVCLGDDFSPRTSSAFPSSPSSSTSSSNHPLFGSHRVTRVQDQDSASFERRSSIINMGFRPHVPRVSKLKRCDQRTHSAQTDSCPLSIDGRRRNGSVLTNPCFERHQANPITEQPLTSLQNRSSMNAEYKKLLNEQCDMLRLLEDMVDRQQRAEAEYERIREWHFLALVADRCLFIVFGIVTITSTLWLLVFQPMTKHTRHLRMENSTNMTPV